MRLTILFVKTTQAAVSKAMYRNWFLEEKAFELVKKDNFENQTEKIL